MELKFKPTFYIAALTALLTFGSAQPGFAHGGGLDWQGGHNCRVGSCAGTYHCHQARGGVCALNSATPKPGPKVLKKLKVQCIEESDESLNRNQVAMIQYRLNSLGYNAGTQDGTYGNLTVNALNLFESRSKLAKSTKSNIENETLVALGTMC